MKRIIDRAGWALAGALGLMLMLVAARVIQAGPLDPLNAPAPTMKTLDNVPGSWSRLLPANDGPDSCNSSRFFCVLPTVGTPTGEAVLDRETGLVWQRVAPGGFATWAVAALECETSLTGGRRGWRLPGPNELGSLGNTATGLPTGHPFTAIAGQRWTSAPSPFDPSVIVTVDPTTSIVIGSTAARSATPRARTWCVRGAGGGEIDAQSPFPEVWRADQLPANDGASVTQSSRFKAVDGAASVVLDHETGLAWQVTPAATASAWAAAVNACTRFSSIATGLGWRLPTLAEQLSLYTSTGTGTLPTGHPFTGITGVYWTSTTDAATTANANTVDTAQVETSTSLLKTTATPRHWCVRGGPGD